MSTLKMATFNVEWMVKLFKPKKAEFWPKESKTGGLGSKPKNVPMVCGRIAGVINGLKADIIAAC